MKRSFHIENFSYYQLEILLDSLVNHRKEIFSSLISVNENHNYSIDLIFDLQKHIIHRILQLNILETKFRNHD